MTPRSTDGAQEQLREGQTFAHRGSRWLVYANFVKLPHTLFALPFALVGVVLASYRSAVTWPMVGWIVLAFTGARFAAMGFNRIVDREIDARNPRTRQREIPSGLLRVTEAVAAVTVASIVFVYAAWRLNPLCALLSPLALAIARALHLGTVICLAMVGAATFTGTRGGSLYALGVVVAAGLLAYEHSLVHADDYSKLDAAFFTMNGVISIVFFVCVLLERL